METLDNTEWDVLIAGTGLKQSLLALALSRSDKKILHVDENNYYGGSEAALSLQEAEEWAQQLVKDPSAGAFSNASVIKPEPADPTSIGSKLSPSRAYSLALCPQIIYARSALLQHLVSSKVYRQLEFLAVGSWWVFSPPSGAEDASVDELASQRGKLLKVPNGREDVFQDQVLDFKAKRALMKFLRFITEFEDQPEIWSEYRQEPFPEFLSRQFKVPTVLQAPLLALSLSPASSNHTTTEYALPRIATHLRSIGVFGAGFGSVIPKWGGLSEVTQVACRACAVGGGVYVLGQGPGGDGAAASPVDGSQGTTELKLRLKDGETVKAKWLVGEVPQSSGPTSSTACRSITIVSSPLSPLFPPIAEEVPPPAAAVVVFPSGSLKLAPPVAGADELPPVYIFVHSSETGECPAGQSVLYASTLLSGEPGLQLLDRAVQALLSSVEVEPSPRTLWSLRYEQRSGVSSTPGLSTVGEHILNFTLSPLDLAFDDDVLEHVKEVWQKVTGDTAGNFLVFEDRDGQAEDDE